MNRDYSYCSGVTCEIRQSCKRYLPNPPDMVLLWVEPKYIKESKQCKNFYIRKKILFMREELRHEKMSLL